MACSSCNGCLVSECHPGKYGIGCDLSCSANCHTLSCDSCACEICNRTSGFCSNGCEFGWYGNTCESVCSQNCQVPTDQVSSCDEITGNCLSGCQRGYYGGQCNITCNSFCTDSLCDQNNGTCLNGCINGHVADICGENNNRDDSNDAIAGAIGGGFVVVLWALVVIILICFIWKRRLKNVAIFNRNTDLATGGSIRSSESRRLHKQHSHSSRGSGGVEEYCVTDELYPAEQYCGTRHSRRSRSLYKKRSVTFDEGIAVPCMCNHTGSHEYFIIADDVGQEQACPCPHNEYRVQFTNGKRAMPKRSSSENDITCSISTWRTDQ
ncbi:hypothetical protein ACF0H5_018116 [Mactra antiquata]